MTAKLKEAGLKPVELRYSYGPLGHFAWMLLIKLPMLWMTKIGKLALLLMIPWYFVVLIPGLLFMMVDMMSDHKKGTGILALAKKSGY